MKKGDWILVYSSKVTMNGNDKCQAFTAIGQVIDDDVYQFQMSRDFIPFRRNIKFYDCHEISILPLINELDFIQNKQLWGYPFRYGFLEIKENDFGIISSNLFKNEITE
jgi:predicted RNA-binding protein